MATELRSFLDTEKKSSCHQLWEAARQRALEILSVLSTSE
jgi:hypothetical protein